MNREQRRRAARRAADAHQVAVGYQCPDCNAETQLVEDQRGVFILRVAHDDTCPAYKAMIRSTP
ncbi:hypothetical protein N5P18_15650 [Janibacter terrae]|uniref:Small CPxCG-related zinc finger protein n=1 Tax=Janibacter terrae TaxID=103817 RepID=A0ABZ2FCN9_9MICO